MFFGNKFIWKNLHESIWEQITCWLSYRYLLLLAFICDVARHEILYFRQFLLSLNLRVNKIFQCVKVPLVIQWKNLESSPWKFKPLIIFKNLCCSGNDWQEKWRTTTTTNWLFKLNSMFNWNSWLLIEKFINRELKEI